MLVVKQEEFLLGFSLSRFFFLCVCVKTGENRSNNDLFLEITSIIWLQQELGYERTHGVWAKIHAVQQKQGEKCLPIRNASYYAPKAEASVKS